VIYAATSINGSVDIKENKMTTDRIDSKHKAFTQKSNLMKIIRSARKYCPSTTLTKRLSISTQCGYSTLIRWSMPGSAAGSPVLSTVPCGSVTHSLRAPPFTFHEGAPSNPPPSTPHLPPPSILPPSPRPKAASCEGGRWGTTTQGLPGWSRQHCPEVGNRWSSQT